MTYEQTLALCRSYVAEHQLTCELDTPKYKGYRMAKPGTRMYCVLLTFTPESITLSGDYRVTNDRAVSSDPGLDLGWFAGQLGSDYLASKFLRHRWVPEACAKAIEEHAEELERESGKQGGTGHHEHAVHLAEKSKTLREIASNCTSDADLHDVHDQLEAVAPSLVDEGMPGYTYDYMERASLTAIQEKFAELYKAWAAKTPAPAPTTDWLQQSESYRKLIESSMAKYSELLGWGITGAQPECWTMLDLAVERMATLDRELPKVATNLSDMLPALRVHNHEAVRRAERQLMDVLVRLKALGMEPFQTVAVKS